MPRSSQTLKKPDFVIFDIDDTLYNYDECHKPGLDITIKAIATDFDLPIDAVHEAMANARASVKAYLEKSASSHSRLLYFIRLFEILGFGSRLNDAASYERMYWGEYFSRMSLVEGMRELLAELREGSVRLMIASDFGADVQIRKLNVLGVIDYFECAAFSEETRKDKYSGEVYSLLKDKVGLKNEDPVWMIGDSDGDFAAKNFIDASTIHANFFGKRPALDKCDFVASKVEDILQLYRKCL